MQPRGCTHTRSSPTTGARDGNVANWRVTSKYARSRRDTALNRLHSLKSPSNRWKSRARRAAQLEELLRLQRALARAHAEMQRHDLQRDAVDVSRAPRARRGGDSRAARHRERAARGSASASARHCRTPRRRARTPGRMRHACRACGPSARAATRRSAPAHSRTLAAPRSRHAGGERRRTCGPRRSCRRCPCGRARCTWPRAAVVIVLARSLLIFGGVGAARSARDEPV